ncbi:MAG TPA: serine/threonine-protein kinase [Polyangiaceae bacterium]|nr:serine/threonine-protein kinase [Polyangiaceae bacterium]
MGSGSATNDLTSPSSASSPRFNEPEALSFERPTMQVGRYRILSELGRGGMSNVFLAVASGPGGVNKLVVLKALLPDLATEGYALSMFMDEARLAAQLNHPNVVQTYEVGTEGDRHVIVMEYLEGQSLSAAVRRAAAEGNPMPLALQLRIIINALDGLHYAHELSGYEGASLQLVHRDISPQNVFVTYDGQVKVLDFGIAKATSASTHTAAGVMKGKIAYMAPEQIVGGNVDRRADLYSVGCMLWAAATGVKLWKDTPDVQIMRRAISGDVPTPQSVNPECDDDLNRIVMKALAREPDDRYATAVDLQHDLEVYVERFGAAAKQKEIARFISTLFADTRAQLKALVERQLTLIQTDNSSVSRERPRPAAKGSSTLGGSSSESIHTLLAEPVEPGRGKRRVVGVLAVVALLGAVSFYAWGKRGIAGEVATAVDTSGATKVAAPVAPATATATATRVSVALQASPAEAKLFLDDEPLAANPTTKLMLTDGKAHVLRAEAPGFANATSEFSPSKDSTVALTLTPVDRATKTSDSSSSSSSTHRSYIRFGRPAAGTAPATAPVAAVPAAAPTPTPAAAAPAKPDCSNPIFLDKDGIRRVRPECR